MFTASVFACILAPIANKFRSSELGAVIAVILFFIFFGIGIFAYYTLAKMIYAKFVVMLPMLGEKFNIQCGDSFYFRFYRDINGDKSTLDATYLMNIAKKVFEYLPISALGYFMVPILILYILIYRDSWLGWIKKFTPIRYESTALMLSIEIYNNLLLWVIAHIQYVTILIMIYSIVLLSFKFPLYTIIIMIPIIAFNSLVPYIGDTISIMVATLFYFEHINDINIFVMFMIVLLLSTMFCNSVISPYICAKAINIPPIALIFITMISGILLGFIGVFFAVPIAIIIKIFITHMITKSLDKENKQFN